MLPAWSEDREAHGWLLCFDNGGGKGAVVMVVFEWVEGQLRLGSCTPANTVRGEAVTSSLVRGELR